MRIKDWYCPKCKKFRSGYVQAIEKYPSTSASPGWRLCCKKCITPLISIKTEVEKIVKKVDEEYEKKMLAEPEPKEKIPKFKEEKTPKFKTVPITIPDDSVSWEEVNQKVREILAGYICDMEDKTSVEDKTNVIKSDEPLTMAERDALEINEDGNCKESKSTTNKIDGVLIPSSDFTANLNFRDLMYTQEQIDALPPGSVYVAKVLHEEGDIYCNYIKTSETNSELLGEYDYFEDHYFI